MPPSDYEYRGLMAASWDLLRGDTSRWADRFLYLEVIQESGQPVLDVGCGTGRLLLDYLALGIDIEGVDNSPEMLARLEEKAARAGLKPVVYRATMEDLDLPRRYRTILVPSSSFQLLTDPQAARQALGRFYAHLEPGGTLALPFFVIRRTEGIERNTYTEDWHLMGEQVRPEDGLLLRYWGRSTYDFTRQLESTESRYELVREGELIGQEEHTRSPADCWYSQDQVRDLLEGAGFVGLRFFHEFTRDPARPDDSLFTVLAERPRERDSAYISDIPAEAEARPGTGELGEETGLVEYYLGDQLVGRRWFDADGVVTFEIPYQDGFQHGRLYRWDIPGQLLSIEPFRIGRPHGVAYQWGDEGRLIGTYAMENGTGLDLWYSECGGPPILSEVRHAVDGALHGYEWWLSADGKQVSEERHWQAGQLHGIERYWNRQGRLRRGYPRYWVRGQRVDRRRYLRAAAGDETLPPFRQEDNRPEREFPPEIQRLLGQGG